MTRENKLALIIGFGLVLVVGILVSDHLSAASRQDVADLSPDAEQANNERLQNTALLTPVYGERDRPRSGGDRAGDAIAINDVEAGSNPGHRDPLIVDFAEEPDSMLAGRIHMPLDDRGIRIDDPPRNNVGTFEDILLPGQDDLIREDLEEARARLETATTQHRIAITWYTIRGGETLAKIAREKLGDASLWRNLHEINRDRIPDPNVVPAGVTIRLPKKDDLLAALGRDGSEGGNSAPPESSPPQNESALRLTTYTVKPGESLSKVAAKVLGTGNRWRELYELNKDVIKNPDNVPAGTVLKVPAR